MQSSSEVDHEAIDSDTPPLQQTTLHRAQFEFAKVFGSLLAETWRNAQPVPQVDSSLENQK